MKITNLLPPETITVRLPGEAMERLKLIQSARESSGIKWKLDELAAKVFADLLTEAELEDAPETPKQPRGRRGGVAVEANGVEAHD